MENKQKENLKEFSGDQNQTTSKRRLSFRTRLIFLLLVIVFILCAYIYLTLQSTKKLKNQYNQYSKNIETLQSEQARCSNLLSQESGQFSDYEYCRKLLQEFPKSE